MKRLFYSFWISLLFSLSALAQNEGISFQGLARNAAGEVLVSQPISLRLSILLGSESGAIAYTETRQTTTNPQGIFAVVLGDNSALTKSTNFSTIDWGTASKFIKVEMDPNAGTNFTAMGTTKLQAVPMAYYAFGVDAENVDGILPVSSGGTGVASMTDLKKSLGLDVFNNAALDTKVDKVAGKGLSTNDYSTAEKNKLEVITGTNTGDQVNITGNAGTATKLQNARTINGVAFDGSGDITLPTSAAGIPYTGATQAVDLGAFDLKVNGLTIGRGNNRVDNNVAIGQSALSSTTTGFQGNYLTAVGFEALKNDTWGYFNTGIGSSALFSNTTGLANTAVGSNSLYNNTTASYNTAVGASALYNNTTGNYNTASGAGALEYNSTGEQNSAFGRNALSSNTTGSINTATGTGALSANTAGGANTANGASALTFNLAGGGNTAMGNNALRNTNGSENTAIGNNAGVLNTTGTNNTSIGGYADFGANNLTNATAIGYGASVAASNTIQLGNASVTNVNTSGNLTVNGIQFGRGAGNVSTNTAAGSLALSSNTSGGSNTAVGVGSLQNNLTGGFNTSIGSDALKMNTGSYNIAVGSNALKNNAGGDFNTAMGYGSNASHTSGSNNASFGTSALASNTGSGNTAMGASADVYAGISNATAIGFQANATASNSIQLGNTSVTDVKTSGTLTAGTVTYPNTHGSANQVLSTTGSGTLAWTTQAAGLPTSGNTAGDMLYWDGSAWVKVPAGSNGQTLSFQNGAPTWKGTFSYRNTVKSATGKIWMDRNLGASQVATSATDVLAYGDLYQWGRGSDGHESRSAGEINVVSASDTPGHGDFINSSSARWRNPTNLNLWQGVNGINNPCPAGFRLPTKSEWEAEIATWSGSGFDSPLKLPLGGHQHPTLSTPWQVGGTGSYWSSTPNDGLHSWNLGLGSSTKTMGTAQQGHGFSVRCIKDY
jgi:hypothetical protein